MSEKNTPPPPRLPPSFKVDEDFCLFHKGEIGDESYICPNCKTRYCLKCAKEAKLSQKPCIKCKSLILL